MLNVVPLNRSTLDLRFSTENVADRVCPLATLLPAL